MVAWLPFAEALARDFPNAPPDRATVEYHIGLSPDAFITLEADRPRNVIRNIGVRAYDAASGRCVAHWLDLDGLDPDSKLYSDICSVLIAVAEQPKLDKMINVDVWKPKSATEVVGAYADPRLLNTVRRVVTGLTPARAHK